MAVRGIFPVALCGLFRYNRDMETRERNGISFRRLWGLCPGRHLLLLVSLGWTLFYFTFRHRQDWMNVICHAVVRPWHRIASRLGSFIPVSLAEILIAVAVIFGIWILVRLWREARRKDWSKVYRRILTLLSLASLFFGLFSLWWGVFYYSDSFQQQSGLRAQPVSREELLYTTVYFAALANEYSDQVSRDENGAFTMDLQDVFDRSETLYHEVSALYPCLAAPDTRPKPVRFSRLMSYVKTTGFFFPITAEANINVDAPLYTIPATIAHELAHQRGVAREDEANFVAVLSCLENGDPDFVYSAAMMAYTYLGNALHRTDYNVWYAVYSALSDPVKLDLRLHNQYWDRFETKVADVSETMYEGFLRTYGDNRGMQSYGACVDLLVAYYGPDAYKP